MCIMVIGCTRHFVYKFIVWCIQGATLNEFIVLKLHYQTVTALLAKFFIVSFAEHYKTFMYTHHFVTVSIIFHNQGKYLNISFIVFLHSSFHKYNCFQQLHLWNDECNVQIKGGNAACFKIAVPWNCKIESSFKLLLL